MENTELLIVEEQIKELEKDLFQLYKLRRAIISNIHYKVGDCFTQSIYYYKVLDINPTNNTYKVLCVVTDRDNIGICIIDDITAETADSYTPLSNETFDSMFLNAKTYLYKHHVNLAK